jgi:hypothetical protein
LFFTSSKRRETMFIRTLAIASLAVVALSLTACGGQDDSNPEAAPEANITTAKKAGGSFETFVGEDGKNYFRLWRPTV